MHLGPFGCLTKLVAKRTELVQKFVLRSRVGFFVDERTQSTILDPKLTFWCISCYLGAFGTVWLPYETRCKTGRSSANVRATKSRRTLRNECTRSTPLDPKLMFWCVSMICVHSGPFGFLTKVVAKRTELVQKSVLRSRVGIFRNECTQTTTLDPKLTFWSISYYLGAFGTVWLPYKTQCKTGRSGAKVCAMKSCWNFSQQTTRSTPLEPNLMFLCISYYLGAFGTVCCVTTLSSKRAKLVQKFVP